MTIRPKRRERYNAKARQSSVGGSHKGKKSMRERIADQEANSNALVMDDATRAALADAERRRREVSASSTDVAIAGEWKRRAQAAFLEKETKA